ncbi:MAG: flagellar biosynthesis anti-sigma factor FlgM [Steroidobacteraceae bacterium]
MGSNISAVEGDRPTPVDTGRVTAGSHGGSGGAAPAAPETTSVHITETAGQLATLEQAVRQMPAVDDSRVAAVRTAIEQGTYTVSPEDIADHLLQLEQSLESLVRRE